jgi:hypothetical protein
MTDKFIVGKKYTFVRGCSGNPYRCDYVGKERVMFTSAQGKEYTEFITNRYAYTEHVEKKTIVRYYNVYKNARGLYLGQIAKDTRELVDNAGSLSMRVGVKRVEIELVEGQYDE